MSFQDRNIGSLHYTTYEENDSKHYSHLDSHGEIDNDSKEECN